MPSRCGAGVGETEREGERRHRSPVLRSGADRKAKPKRSCDKGNGDPGIGLILKGEIGDNPACEQYGEPDEPAVCFGLERAARGSKSDKNLAVAASSGPTAPLAKILVASNSHCRARELASALLPRSPLPRIQGHATSRPHPPLAPHLQVLPHP